MSRTSRSLLTLLFALCLLVGLSVTAAPSTDGPAPWWSALAQVWQQIVAPFSSGDGSNIGPDFDPDGVMSTTTDDDESNMGPDFDPDGFTATTTDQSGNAGPDFDPDGLTATTAADADNMGPDFDPNG